MVSAFQTPQQRQMTCSLRACWHSLPSVGSHLKLKSSFTSKYLVACGTRIRLSPVWTLSCNSSPLVCANLFSHSEHEKCFQLNDFMFALFTRVWFLSCMCFSVLLNGWICSCVVHKGMVPFCPNLLWHVGQGNGFSSVWTLSCNSSPLVCAKFFSHSEHEKCCQLNDFMFALFTSVWLLSCMCFSVL